MKISVIFLDLPKKRHQRKCEQLENLATAVLEIHHPGDVIVDFCSGGVGRNVDWVIQLHYMPSSSRTKIIFILSLYNVVHLLEHNILM